MLIDFLSVLAFLFEVFTVFIGVCAIFSGMYTLGLLFDEEPLKEVMAPAALAIILSLATAAMLMALGAGWETTSVAMLLLVLWQLGLGFLVALV